MTRAIAKTTLRGLLYARSSYALFALAVVVSLFMFSSLVYMQMAQEAGEAQMLTKMRAGGLQSALGFWHTVVTIFGLYLGATAVGSEAKTKTIVTVLARPVPRWQFLAGKSLGLLTFLFAFLALGVAGALVLIAYWDLSYSALLWLGMAELFVELVFLTGASLGLGAMLSPVAAGSLAFFLTLLPSLVRHTAEHPNLALRWLSRLAYFLSPARMDQDLLGQSFDRELLNPDYSLYAQVLAENLLYTLVVMVVGCVVFTRRDVPLK